MKKASLWQYVSFRRLLGSTLANDVAQSMAYIVVPLTVLANGASASTAGLVTAIVAATGILSQIFSGVIADRFNSGKLIRVSSLIQMSCWVSVALLQSTGHNTVVATAVLASVAAAFASITVPSEHSIIQKILPQELYTQANGVTQGREAAANLLGAPFAGLVFAVSHVATYVVQSLCHVLAAVLVPAVKSQPVEATADASGLIDELKSGFRFVWNDSSLRAIVATASIINLPLAMMPIIMISYFEKSSYSSTLIGFYMSTMGLGIFLGSFVAGRVLDRFKPIIVGTATIIALTLSMFATAFVYEDFVFSCVVFFAGGLLLPAFNSLIASYTMTVTPEHLIGRVVAASGVPGMILMPLGSYLGGLMLDSFGIFIALLCASIIAGVSMVPLFSSLDFVRMGHIVEPSGGT